MRLCVRGLPLFDATRGISRESLGSSGQEGHGIHVSSEHDAEPEPLEKRTILLLKEDVHPSGVPSLTGIQGDLHQTGPHPSALDLRMDAYIVDQEISVWASHYLKEAHEPAVQPCAYGKDVLIQEPLIITFHRPAHGTSQRGQLFRTDRKIDAKDYLVAAVGPL